MDFSTYLTSKLGLALLKSTKRGEIAPALTVPHIVTVPRLPGLSLLPIGIVPEKTKIPKIAKTIKTAITII